MLLIMGHEDVEDLDGGLSKWISEHRPIEDVPPQPSEGHFTVRYHCSMCRTHDVVQRVLETGKEQVVDARPAARFEGREPEPRPGVRSGHIPGSRNLPWETLIGPEGAVLPAEKLAEKFAEVGVDVKKPVVTSCGSGVTAA